VIATCFDIDDRHNVPEPMRLLRRCRIAAALTLLASIALAAPVARAGGPAFTRLFAPAETAQTAYLNPAGMTRIKDPMLTNQLIPGRG